MQDLLKYLTTGLEVSRSVDVFANRQALLEYGKLETQIANTIAQDKLLELVSIQEGLKKEILESKITVNLTLASQETRERVRAEVMSEFHITPETEEGSLSNEFARELSLRMIHSSLVSIDRSGSVDKDISLEDFRAFMDLMQQVPANWSSIIDAFSELVNSEFISNAEHQSVDFS